MAAFRRRKMRTVVTLGTMVLGLGIGAQRTWATAAPPDPCSLLTAAQVSNALGQQYGTPEKSCLLYTF